MIRRATFRFQGELNDFLVLERRHAAFEHAFSATDTLKHLVQSMGVPHVEVGRVEVNGAQAPLNRQLADGDRVEVHPRQPEPADYTFVLDGHLGRLAAYLRMLGFDVWYDRYADDAQLADISAAEQRILFTRDLELLMRSKVSGGFYIRSDKPHTQLRDVVARFHLHSRMRPFSRCMSCNGPLQAVNKEAVADRLPPHTRATRTEFSICTRCEKIYWKGSHHDRMMRWVSALTQGLS